MALRASDLSKKGKSGSTANEVLIVQNTETNKASQFPLDDVFPILQSGSIASGGTLGTAKAKTDPATMFVGGGFGSVVSGTDKNTLIFKGLRSNSNALVFKDETLTGNAQKGNLVIELDQASIDLSTCDNTTSGFLSTVALASNVSGTLPVANGGTNATSFTDKSVVITQASGTDTLSSSRMDTNGYLLIGGTSGPGSATLTAGTNVTITNGDRSIEIAAAISTLTSTLDADNNNIQMGTGWISNDGANEGLNLSTTGQLFVGVSTPTSYFDDALNIGGGITLGTNTGSSESISMRDTTTGATGNLTIHGSDASGTGNAGGNVTISAGDGDTNGSGGALYLDAGRKAGSGTEGSVIVRTAGTAALTIGPSQTTTSAGAITATSGNVTATDGDVVVTAADHGLIHTGMGAVTQGTTAGFVDGVVLNATSGKITLCSTCTLAGDATASFIVSNSLVTADSLILLTLFDKTGSGNSRYSVSLGNQGSGTFTVLLHNQENSISTAGVMRVNFLVINPV